MHVYGYRCPCNMYVEVKGQLLEMGSSILPCKFQGLKSGCHTCMLRVFDHGTISLTQLVLYRMNR